MKRQENDTFNTQMTENQSLKLILCNVFELLKIKTNIMNFVNLESPAYCEAKGLSKVFKAYANQCEREDILEVGFNKNSGYVYIALENGISICSMLGRDVEYIVTDFEDGTEYFLETYTESEEKLNELV